MNQFSGDGSPIELELISGQLIFIDPLYLEDIRIAVEMKEVDTIQEKIDIQSIEAKEFPYGGGTLIGYKQLDRNLLTYKLDIHEIIAINLDNEELEEKAINKEITTSQLTPPHFL